MNEKKQAEEKEVFNIFNKIKPHHLERLAIVYLSVKHSASS